MVNSAALHRHKFTTHADGSDAVLFLHELLGEQDGPTIGISGCIHGNENTGSQAILELYRALKSTPLKGRIVFLPVANVRAFAVNHRFTPIDELNLNREFPGDVRLAQKVAGGGIEFEPGGTFDDCVFRRFDLEERADLFAIHLPCL